MTTARVRARDRRGRQPGGRPASLIIRPTRTPRRPPHGPTFARAAAAHAARLSRYCRYKRTYLRLSLLVIDTTNDYRSREATAYTLIFIRMYTAALELAAAGPRFGRAVAACADAVHLGVVPGSSVAFRRDGTLPGRPQVRLCSAALSVIRGNARSDGCGIVGTPRPQLMTVEESLNAY